MSMIRLGAIPYLNAKPIFYGLEAGLGAERFEIGYHSPAECARKLADGELDLALIPSIEYARTEGGGEGLWIVPDIAIASEGPVASVLLLAKVPLEELKVVAVDVSSRSSATLLQILCAESYGIAPETEKAEPEPAMMLERYGAAMVIGDPALYCAEKVVVRRDLGADWSELTGHPFVYAFLAGRESAIGAEDVAVLRDSLRQGLLSIHKIAANHPTPLQDGTELNENYLRENMRYSFSDKELTGLKLFYIKAWEHGLIDGVPRIRFYEG